MRSQLEMHVVFQGLVQGVGFRAMTKRYADALKLTGFVQNLSTDQVELCAQGSKEDLQTLLHLLQAKFGSSHINGHTAKFSTPTHTYTDFRSI